MLRKLVVRGLLFVIIIFLVSCSIQSKTNNDLTEFNLNGKVKSIIEKRYEALFRFDEIEAGELIDNYSEIIFNENGFISEKNFYSINDTLISKLKYYYNDDNNIITINFFDAEGKKDSSYNFEYNNNSEIISRKTINESGQTNIEIVYNYDENDNLFEEIEYDFELKRIDFIKKYFYDDNNVLKEIVITQAPDYKWIYQYNSDGIVEKVYIDDSDIAYTYEHEDSTKVIRYLNNELFETEERKYNSKGKLIERKTLRPDNSISDYWSLEYDKQGNIIKEIDYYYFGEEKYYTKTLNKYDDKNNKIEEKEYNEDGIIEGKRKYDIQGNTLELVNYYNGKSQFKFNYTYDENNNEKTCTLDFGYFKEQKKYEYEYDENKNIIKKIDLIGQDIIEGFEYKYRKDGVILEVKKFRYDDSERIPEYYKRYDDNDNLIEEKSYYYDGNLRDCNKYDKNGNNIERSLYNVFGELRQTVYYTYNDENNLTSETISNPDKYEEKIILSYDESNNLIEKKSIDINNNQIQKINYVYDEDGLSKSYKLFNAENILVYGFNNSFQKDDKSNWIVKIVKDLDEKPISIFKREINYY